MFFESPKSLKQNSISIRLARGSKRGQFNKRLGRSRLYLPGKVYKGLYSGVLAIPFAFNGVAYLLKLISISHAMFATILFKLWLSDPSSLYLSIPLVLASYTIEIE